MVDRQYADPRLAALYDPLCGTDQRDDFGFYLPLVMAAPSVLDVGCGTGALLHLAREHGHDGRLVGLDPAVGMLSMARLRRDIDWVLGDLTTASWDAEFDLVLMTGHAFQVLVTDDEVPDTLAAIRRALTPGGTFAFETRNPAARAWETWDDGYGADFTDVDGTPARFDAVIDGPVVDGVLGFTTTYRRADWAAPEPSHSTLRFLDEPTLDVFLAAAGLTPSARSGDWDGSAVTATSPELITLARRT